jgi:hypothetical protein
MTALPGGNYRIYTRAGSLRLVSQQLHSVGIRPDGGNLFLQENGVLNRSIESCDRVTKKNSI